MKMTKWQKYHKDIIKHFKLKIAPNIVQIPN